MPGSPTTRRRGSSTGCPSCGPVLSKRAGRSRRCSWALRPTQRCSSAANWPGRRDQVMHSGMRPVVAGAPILGPAFTIQALAQPTESGEPYERELAAVDAIPSEAVVVFNAGGVSEAGIWGELLSTRALARGAIGAVIDGAVRDL